MTIFDLLLAVHLVAIVWWIGGVALVTCVLLPSVHRLAGEERIARIKQFEHRFASQARLAVLLVGITGFWMLALSGWARLASAHAWWLDLMILVWTLFALMLFIAEPLRLPARIGLMRKPTGFLLLHAFMLTLALATVFCGVIGARGGFA
jgi:uncharacterized membrane protein